MGFAATLFFVPETKGKTLEELYSCPLTDSPSWHAIANRDGDGKQGRGVLGACPRARRVRRPPGAVLYQALHSTAGRAARATVRRAQRGQG